MKKLVVNVEWVFIKHLKILRARAVRCHTTFVYVCCFFSVIFFVSVTSCRESFWGLCFKTETFLKIRSNKKLKKVCFFMMGWGGDLISCFAIQNLAHLVMTSGGRVGSVVFWSPVPSLLVLMISSAYPMLMNLGQFCPKRSAYSYTLNICQLWPVELVDWKFMMDRNYDWRFQFVHGNGRYTVWRSTIFLIAFNDL